MTKKKKILLLFVAGLFGLFGYGAYNFYGAPSQNFNAIYLIPKNAVYIIETDQPIESWKKISGGRIWQYMRTNAYFGELTASANSLDSTIRDSPALFKILGDRKVMVSAHNYKPNDYDFLFIVDLREASKISILKDHFDKFVGSGYEVSRRVYKDQEIIELYDKKKKTRLNISFIENLVACSFTHTLVEAAIDQRHEPVIGRDVDYIDISKQVDDSGLIKFFLQYRYLDEHMKAFMDGENEYVKILSEAFLYTGAKLELTDEQTIRFDGMTSVNDSVNSYLRAMHRSGKGDISATKVAPRRTAFYMSIGFENFGEFYDNIEERLKTDPKAYEEYKTNIDRLQKYLKINLKEDFFSWVEDEAAFIQTQPKGLGRDNEFAAVLKASSGSEAKEKLAFISNQIRKRTPVKFKGVVYREHTINFMSVKGLFKVLLGGFFSKLDKPYFTVIDDFVVFSNHPSTIKSIIDDYLDGKTLDKAPGFEEFKKKNFNAEANMFAYIQMPVMFPNLQPLVDKETWASMQKNKNYILCFNHIGFQLTQNGKGFETRFVSSFYDIEKVLAGERKAGQETATGEYGFELAEGGVISAEDMAAMHGGITADDLTSIEDINPDDLDADEYEEYYDDDKNRLKRAVGMKDGLKHGNYREYYETGEIKVKGKYKDDLQEGVWKYYEADGKLSKKAKFRKGQEE